MKKPDKAGLFLDIDKYEFLKKEVKYFGFIIRSDENIIVVPEKVKSIEE